MRNSKPISGIDLSKSNLRWLAGKLQQKIHSVSPLENNRGVRVMFKYEGAQLHIPQNGNVQLLVHLDSGPDASWHPVQGCVSEIRNYLLKRGLIPE